MRISIFDNIVTTALTAADACMYDPEEYRAYLTCRSAPYANAPAAVAVAAVVGMLSRKGGNHAPCNDVWGSAHKPVLMACNATVSSAVTANLLHMNAG